LPFPCSFSCRSPFSPTRAIEDLKGSVVDTSSCSHSSLLIPTLIPVSTPSCEPPESICPFVPRTASCNGPRAEPLSLFPRFTHQP
jgi:hypothetical protein